MKQITMFGNEEERIEYRRNIANRVANLKKLSKEKNGLEDIVNDVLGNGVIEVDVKIPLKKNGRDFFNLRESILLQVEREHKLIRLNAPDGSRIVEAKEWRQGAEITYQKFNYDTPLCLVGNFIFKDSPT